MSYSTSTELSEREREILRLLATGASNKEIALQLSISANTVKVHLRNIFAKIGAASRTEAALYAIRTGLVESGVVVDVPSITESQPDTAIETLPPPQEKSEIPPAPTGLPQPRSNRGLGLILAAGLLLVLLLLAANTWLNRPVPEAAGANPTSTLSAGRWTPHPPMPQGRAAPAAAIYENQIYVIGGSDVAGQPLASTLRYNPEDQSWQALADKPFAVQNVSAGVIGGKLYLPGGAGQDGQPGQFMEIYNLSTERWERGPDLPLPLSGYALAVFEGRLYLFGGWNGQALSDLVLVYDPANDSWEKRGPLPLALQDSAAVVVGSRIHLLGGADSSGDTDLHLVYTPANEENAWLQAARLPEKCRAAGAVNIADQIYLFGGEHTGPNTDKQMYVYTQETDTWGMIEVPPAENIHQSSLVGLGRSLFILGGRAVQTSATSPLIAELPVLYSLSMPITIR